MDEYTLNEIEKFIEKRVDKLKTRVKLYERTDTRYIVYKNLIMELQTIKEQIKAKKKGAKNERDN